MFGAGAAITGVAAVLAPKQPMQAGSQEPDVHAIAEMKRALKAEPQVKDFLYQPGQAVEWQVGVFDDGTSRVGFANYVCELLSLKGALKPTTEVRIVDVRKVAAGQGLRAASLGHVACSDRRVIDP